MKASFWWAFLWGALGLTNSIFGQNPIPEAADLQAFWNESPAALLKENASVKPRSRCAAYIPNLREYGLKLVNLWVSHGDATLIFLPSGEIALVDTGQDFAVKE